jgi:diguanylate cyclase (GGDEF)-like protein/PAS domain S-box-containing protein
MQLHTGTKGLSLHQKQRITPLDGQRIRGEHLLSDILGTPILTLQLDSKRSIYLLGQKSARDVALSLLLSGSLIGIALFMYGEKGIVRHLIRMSNKADEIAQSGDTSQRLEICGAPELQRLGSAVNNMLESLEQAHREIQESEQKHRTVLQQSSDAIILYDPALERIIDANQAFYRMTGYEAEDLPFLSPLQLLLNQQRLATVVRIARQRDRLHLTDVHCRCKNGSVLEMDVAASLLTIGGRELLSAILRDMTERNREQRMIKEIAITDVLTGIPNRRYLLERAEQEFERLKRHQNRQTDNCTLGCIMLDVDYFKAINDTHGHQCGDTVLAELARRVGISVRPYDIIGRYGGEEFAVFLTDTTGDQTMIVATRIWQTIRSAPYYFDAHVFPVTASLGISWMKQDDQSVDDILKRADAALYQAKEKGRDRIEA